MMRQSDHVRRNIGDCGLECPPAFILGPKAAMSGDKGGVCSQGHGVIRRGSLTFGCGHTKVLMCPLKRGPVQYFWEKVFLPLLFSQKARCQEIKNKKRL